MGSDISRVRPSIIINFRIIFPLLLFSFSLFLLSCSDNPLIQNDMTDLTEWTLIDSTQNGLVESLAAAEENILYIIRNNSGYKIENGITSQVNFNDNDFYPINVFALNSSYIIFQGWSRSNYYRELKIIKDNVVTSFTGMPQTYHFTDVLIIEKDKFSFGIDSICYLYDNGSLSGTVVRSPYNNAVSIEKLFIADSLVCALVHPVSNTGSYIFSVRNNYAYFLGDEQAGQRFFLGNNLAKLSEGAGTTNLNLYTLSGLRSVFTGPSRDYHHIVGENKNYLYMIASEHTGYYNIKNVLWNGERFIEQSDQPPLLNNNSSMYFSNMKNNVFYCSWSRGSKYYLYKAKRILHN